MHLLAIVLLTLSLTVGLRVPVTYWKIPTWKWSQWPGLNRRPTVYETVALPLSYIGAQVRNSKETVRRSCLLPSRIQNNIGPAGRKQMAANKMASQRLCDRDQMLVKIREAGASGQ